MEPATEHGTQGEAVDGLSRALVGLFPPFVAGAVAPVGDGHAGTRPEERLAVADSAPRRRRQFLTGRACAHEALRAVGRDGPSVTRGAAGQPVWPPGAVGSIAHTEALAVAVAARSDDAAGLGLDLEPLEPPLEARVEGLVSTDEERTRRSTSHPLAPYVGKIAFCVKECVYKALFPWTHWSLEFHDIAVDVDLQRSAYRAVVGEPFRLSGFAVPPLEGRFADAAGYVLAGLCLSPGGPPRAPRTAGPTG